MPVQVFLILLVLKPFVVVLEQLDVTIMLLCHAKGKDLHPEEHVDVDDFTACQLDGALRIMGMVELENAAKQFKPIHQEAKVAPHILAVIGELNFKSLIVAVGDNEVDIVSVLPQPVILHRQPADEDRLVEKFVPKSLDIDR